MIVILLQQRLLVTLLQSQLSAKIRMSSSSPSSSSQQLSTFYNHLQSSKLPFYSLEIFPPSTESGLIRLKNLLNDVRQYRPLFCAITSKTTSRTSELEGFNRFDLAKMIITNYGIDVLLHVTCSDLFNQTQGRQVLNQAKKCGIKYIFALRGDNLSSSNDRHFNYAIDIVKFIKKEFPNDFIIAVAGYPNGHPDTVSFEDNIVYLRDKVDCGADLIISQFFFSQNNYLDWIRSCRSFGIKVPIIPGIFTWPSITSLERMLNKTKVPLDAELSLAIETVRSSESLISARQLSVSLSSQLCLSLASQGACLGFHFFSLNNESTLQVIEIIEPLLTRATVINTALLSDNLNEVDLINEKSKNFDKTATSATN